MYQKSVAVSIGYPHSSQITLKHNGLELATETMGDNYVLIILFSGAATAKPLDCSIPWLMKRVA